jgi:hypothetical protein
MKRSTEASDDRLLAFIFNDMAKGTVVDCAADAAAASRL